MRSREESVAQILMGFTRDTIQAIKGGSFVDVCMAALIMPFMILSSAFGVAIGLIGAAVILPFLVCTLGLNKNIRNAFLDSMKTALACTAFGLFSALMVPVSIIAIPITAGKTLWRKFVFMREVNKIEKGIKTVADVELGLNEGYEKFKNSRPKMPEDIQSAVEAKSNSDAKLTTGNAANNLFAKKEPDQKQDDSNENKNDTRLSK